MSRHDPDPYDAAPRTWSRKRKEQRYCVENRGYETPCWIWQIGALVRGYGREYDEHGRYRIAHRLYYERYVGPIPEGFELDHLCRQRACVNPAHLQPVTSVENKRRGAKLTIEQVREIRASTDRIAEIAEQYGIHKRHVYRVRSGERWADAA